MFFSSYLPRSTYKQYLEGVEIQSGYDEVLKKFVEFMGGIDNFRYNPEHTLRIIANFAANEIKKNGYLSTVGLGGFLSSFFKRVRKDEKEFKFLDDELKKLLPNIQSGEMIGFKKAVLTGGRGCAIVTLRIPEDAKRSKAFGSKWRCDKAFVEDICEYRLKDLSECKDTQLYVFIPKKIGKSNYIIEHHDVAVSCVDPKFFYKKGELVSVDNFEECRWVECAPGIHFFIDEAEAITYCL